MDLLLIEVMMDHHYSTGSLIKLSSKSTNVTNGILRLDTNDVRSGKVSVSIEAIIFEDGSAIAISNDGSALSTGSLDKTIFKINE